MALKQSIEQFVSSPSSSPNTAPIVPPIMKAEAPILKALFARLSRPTLTSSRVIDEAWTVVCCDEFLRCTISESAADAVTLPITGTPVG